MNVRRMDKSEPVPTSSRLLPDIPCKVCSDHSSGKHYGIYACDGCAGFFKRSIRRGRSYECKSRSPASGACAVDKTHRNQCRSCRLRKCLQVGMNKEAVQHERGPRHSTMRRQIAACLKDSPTLGVAAAAGPVASSHVLPAFRPHLLAASGTTGLTGLIPGFADMVHLSSVRITLGPRAFVHQPVPKYPGEISLPFSNSPEVTQELAARVLFRAIKWVKGVQTLAGLSMSDQLLLLNERWIQVFVLTAAESQMTIQPTQLLRAAGIVAESSCSLNDHQVAPAISEIHLLQDILLKFQSLQIDATEFACLRGICFFEADLKSSSSTSSEGRGSHPLCRGSLTDRAPVDALRDQAQLLLTKYIETTYPSQPLRFGRLLLLLPSLASISAATIEDIFFRSTIGDTPIERLIANMYQDEASNGPY